MPIPVTCPACLQRFHVRDEYAGQRGRCPHCGEVFLVPDDYLPELEPLPASRPRHEQPWDSLDDDIQEEQRPRRRRTAQDDWPRWKRIGLACGLEQWATLGLCLGLVLLLVANIALADDPLDMEAEPDTTQIVVAGLALLSGTLGFIVLLVSRFLMTAVPTRSAATLSKFSVGLACLTFASSLLLFCLLVAVLANQQQGGQPDEAVAMLLGVGILGLLGLVAAGEVCHGFALGSIGRVLKADGLRAWGRSLAWYAVSACLVSFLGFCGLGLYMEANNPNMQNAAANKAENLLTLILMLLIALLVLIYFLLNLVALHSARQAIQRIGDATESYSAAPETW